MELELLQRGKAGLSISSRIQADIIAAYFGTPDLSINLRTMVKHDKNPKVSNIDNKICKTSRFVGCASSERRFFFIRANLRTLRLRACRIIR